MDIELTKFPDYYQSYVWDAKHKLFGYPADRYPDFAWIASLEKRFMWLRENSISRDTASKYLLVEMIEWGGSQNGVLQKYQDGGGEVDLRKLIHQLLDDLDSPERAIASALKLPGLGLTYASKLLRFMKPDTYGALDSRIRKKLFLIGRLRKIYDGNEKSMISGYVGFIGLLNELNSELESSGIDKPICSLSETSSWRPAEIEMALFRWAE